MDLLDARDVKRILKISLPMVYKLANQGRLPSVRIPCLGKGGGNRKHIVRFKAEDVAKFIEDNYEGKVSL